MEPGRSLGSALFQGQPTPYSELLLLALNSYKKGLGLKSRATKKWGLNSPWAAWQDGQD